MVCSGLVWRRVPFLFLLRFTHFPFRSVLFLQSNSNSHCIFRCSLQPSWILDLDLEEERTERDDDEAHSTRKERSGECKMWEGKRGKETKLKKLCNGWRPTWNKGKYLIQEGKMDGWIAFLYSFQFFFREGG